MHTRRHFIGMAAAAVVPLAAAGCSWLPRISTAEGSAGKLMRSRLPLPRPFSVPLPVPPTLAPAHADETTDTFEITQRVGRVEIIPGTATEVWGYDGRFPGPTLVSRSGRRTVVRHRNELPVPVSVHLHGGRTPAEHDGYPTDLLHPTSSRTDTGPRQGSRDYLYPMHQPAATLWYHDHRMDFTGPQVYRGLAGFHIIRDDAEERLELPHGDRDVPLMITDRAFTEDGTFAYPSLDSTLAGPPGVREEYMSGVLGDCILVNGAPWPLMEVSNTRYRLRLLNASNARRYRLALDPAPAHGASFVQTGSDQGLLEVPVPLDDVHIAQGERFDVIVDFGRYRVGQEITLVNLLGEGGTALVMRFVVTHRSREESRVPARLRPPEILHPADATVSREFVFARGGERHHGTTLWTVNGEGFDEGHVAASPVLGSVERWRIRTLNVEHPIHIHLGRFQIVRKNGGPPGEHDQGWKDTVNMDSGGDAELLVRFDGYRGRYVFHCHNLEHEDMRMMGNLQVV